MQINLFKQKIKRVSDSRLRKLKNFDTLNFSKHFDHHLVW